MTGDFVDHDVTIGPIQHANSMCRKDGCSCWCQACERHNWRHGRDQTKAEALVEVPEIRAVAERLRDLLAELLSGYPWMQGEWSHAHCDEDAGGNHRLDDEWFGRDAAEAIAALEGVTS